MEVVVEGNCFVSGRLERCSIGIEEGKIVQIAKLLDGDKVYHMGNKIVLPAAIDAHVHFRDPGFTEKEDFGTGSTAALFGGVTCVFDMPNTKPSTTTLASLRDKRRIASAKSYVDFGLFAGIKPGTDVKALAKEAVGFKLYMGSTTGDLLVPDLRTIREEISQVASSGKVLAVHAEDETMRRKETERNLEDHLRNRTNECEISAIRKVKEAATGCRLHICHVSARNSLPLISKVQKLTSEVTPHHLLMDMSSRMGARAKVNPPLRKREDRQGLFQALKSGEFDIVASDHAPHTIDEKGEEFDYAPTGMPGVETLAPLMLQLVKERHLDLGAAVSRLCQRPGEIFGVNKGMIQVGYDADLMAVDMTATTSIDAETLHSKCGWTAFEGMRGIFPRSVFLRGQLMMENGGLVGERSGRDAVGTQ
jgi:dihydroorotase